MATPFYTRTEGADPRNADRNTYPRFYMETVEDLLESTRQGRRCYKEEERVEVIMAGNNLHIPVFRVTDEHRQRWPKQYEAFKSGQETPTEGTPIEEWPALNRAQVMELKFLNFRTVEDIAGASDHALQRIGMGGRILRDRASAFVDDAKRIEIVERQSSELSIATSRVSELEATVKNMSEQMQQIQMRFLQQVDAQPALATMIPGQHDPIELAKQGLPAPQGSGGALAGMQASRRPQLSAKGK